MIKQIVILFILCSISIPLLAQESYEEKYIPVINQKIKEGKCDRAQELYNIYKEMSGNADTSIQNKIYECQKSNGPLKCEYIRLGKFDIEWFDKKKLSFEEKKEIAISQNPTLRKYYYLYDIDRSIDEGKIMISCVGTLITGNHFKSEVSLCTPDHNKNLVNILSRIMKFKEKSARIVIGTIVLPEGKDYMVEDDYRDIIVSFLIEKGYKVVAAANDSAADFLLMSVLKMSECV